MDDYADLDGSGQTARRLVRSWKFWAIVVGIVLFLTGLIIIVALSTYIGATNDDDDDAMAGSLGSALRDTYFSCPASKIELQYDPFYGGSKVVSSSFTFAAGENRTLLANGTLWTGLLGDTPRAGMDILLVNNKISKIGKDLPREDGDVVIELAGRHVTPGIVDMHSHLGVYSYPGDVFGTQDGNEMTNPTLPQMRALDGLDPTDPAIPLIREGGVTTSVVLPGSGNVMGGEAAYVKLHSSDDVQDMLVPNAPRALKMACGENPKRVYGGRNQMPMSRMGVGYSMRKMLFAAAQLKQQQAQWDCQSNKKTTGEPRPFNLELEPLVALLNNQTVLNVHCYEVQDIRMMIRTADEFGIKVAAFHHAVEAWRLPELLVEKGAGVAIFADHWGFKMEAFDPSVFAPKILYEAGVKVALKSDHPVIFAKWLILEAAKAAHYGFPFDAAMASLTSVPAGIIGLSNRVGSLEEGKEADVVVWDGHPLALGSETYLVYIDGILSTDRRANTPNIYPDPPVITSQINGPCTTTSNNYAVTGVTVYTMTTETPITDGVIVVADGIVTCVGTATECPVPAGADTYTMSNGGEAVPGFVHVGDFVGQQEVDSEGVTQNGAVSYISGTSASIRAMDGIRFDSYKKKHMQASWAGGVTSLVAIPQGSSIVTGTGTAFYGNPDLTSIDGALIPNQANQTTGDVSLHMVLGNAAKQGGITASVAGQVRELRKVFQAALNSTDTSDPVVQALQGTLPVMIRALRGDDVAAALRLKAQFGFKLVIFGAADISTVIPLLQGVADVSVILAPARSPPEGVETWQAYEGTAWELQQAGIKVGLALLDAGNVRNIRWEAGLAMAHAQRHQNPNTFNKYQALATVTSNVADMFNLKAGRITVGEAANFQVYTGDSLSLGSNLALLAWRTTTTCNPQQV